MDRTSNQSFSEWFKKRPWIERRLIIPLTIVSFIALALIIVVIIQAHKLHQTEFFDKEICTTPACIRTSAKVLEYADLKMDPCTDFFQFACGGFLKKPIPADEAKISTFEKVKEIVDDQIKALLEDPSGDHSPRFHRLIRDLYETCTNGTAIERKGLWNAKLLIKQLGGWPVLEGDEWKADQFDWKSFSYKFRRLGALGSTVLGFAVAVDFKDSSKYVIQLYEDELPLPRDVILRGLENPTVVTFLDYIIDVAEIFGAPRTRAIAEMRDVMVVLRKIAEFSPIEDQRDLNNFYNPITVRKLQQRYPSIPWLEYTRTMLGHPDIKITDGEIVIVRSHKFLSEFLNLLRRTSKRTVANLLMTLSVISMAPYLTDEVRNRELEFKQVIEGSSQRQPRSKECLKIVSENLNVALGSMYVRKHFNEEARRDVGEIVSDVRAEFAAILRKIDWMDEVTRRNALDKLNAMAVLVGYPDELLNNRLVENYYRTLKFDSKDYLDAITQLALFYNDKQNERLRMPTKDNRWIDYSVPTLVNAGYSLSNNMILITAGFLQGLVFEEERPKYMNYGSLGFSIGHEITHGFDDEGRQFDRDGNMRDWWKTETAIAFQERAQCIVDQYGNYTVPEVQMKIKGVATQGENIADNGGIVQAYLAYRAWADRKGPEPKLPGLQQYTPVQMFWISAAQVWCQKQRSEKLRLDLASGQPHSPGRFRVIGPFGNSGYFARDFGCPKGSGMNPEKKCRVW